MISAIRSGWLAVSEWQVEKADDLLENCMKDFTVQNEWGAMGHMLDAAWCGFQAFIFGPESWSVVQISASRPKLYMTQFDWVSLILYNYVGQASTYVWKTTDLSSSKIATCSFVGHWGADMTAARSKATSWQNGFWSLVHVGWGVWMDLGFLLLRSRPRRFWAFHILLRVIWMIETSGTTARGLMRWCGGILTFLAFAHMLDADHTLMAILRRNECVRFGTEASKGFLLQNCSLLHQNRKLSFKGTQSQRSSCLLSRESHQSWPIFCHIRDTGSRLFGRICHQRTFLEVQDSDGALIFSPRWTWDLPVTHLKLFQ